MKQKSGKCLRVSGFNFHHTIDAFYIQSSAQTIVLDNNVAVDSSVGVYTTKYDPNSESKRYDKDSSITYKNNVFIGRSEFYDCAIDSHETEFNELALKQILPLGFEDHTAILMPDFLSKSNKFPTKNMHKSGVKSPAIYGQTCVHNNHFIGYNGKCGNIDTVVKANRMMIDYSHPVYFKEGNVFIDAGTSASGASGRITQFFRPEIGLVNIADCVDLHCDGHKKILIIDEAGDLLGYPGSITSESEYQWEGVTRNGVTYSDTRAGLGDYRIPTGMLTTLDGKKIDANDYAPEKGGLLFPSILFFESSSIPLYEIHKSMGLYLDPNASQ